ncbi:MAG: HEAT repeat domain-containing protein [Chloroflexi bacterium]|nr:HEAT repeat domain-containing protein [Chloroflexota bacterium]
MNFTKTEIGKRVFRATGIAVALALFVGISVFLLNNVIATPVSPREAQIRGWVNDLHDEALTTERQAAQRQLEAAGEQAVPALVSALHSNDAILRKNAAEMLGYIASPRATEALLQNLRNDPVVAVRVNAAYALGAIPSASALPALESSSVLDASVQVRQTSTDALQNIYARIAQSANKNLNDVNAITVAPGQTNVVYLATKRDLLVSRDGGVNWDTLTQALPGLVSTLNVNPTNAEIVYAGLHSQGMFLSTDGGRTWQSLTRNFSNQAIGQSTVTAITVDPANPMRVVMAHGIRIGDMNTTFFPLGILTSQDGGKSWQYVMDLEEGQIVTRLQVRENKVYALTSDKVLIASLPQ